MVVMSHHWAAATADLADLISLILILLILISQILTSQIRAAQITFGLTKLRRPT
jgi:hypothetical protein